MAHPTRSKASRAARLVAAGEGPGVDPRHRRSMQEFLVHTLGAEIVSGTLPEGQVLPSETEICARFGVSRTTLREAYSVLASKSLIIARQKVGTRVRPRQDWNMLDPDVLAWHIEAAPSEAFIGELMALRQMVEPAAAALAASTADAQTIARIAAAFEHMRQVSLDGGDIVGPDLDFHLSILAATGNRFVGALQSLIHAALTASFRLSWRAADFMHIERLNQHHEVLLAIEAHDPERARTAMARLLVDSMDDVHGYFVARRQ